MGDNFLHYFQLGLPCYLTADTTVASGPRDVILSFINHFPTTQISAPSCEQTSSTCPSSRHWNPPQQAAGRCSDTHIYLSFQWMDCSWCQSCLVLPPVKNKSQILKTLSSPKWKKKKWNKFGSDEAIFSCWRIPNNEKRLLLLILLFLLYNFLKNVFIKLKIQSRGQIDDCGIPYILLLICIWQFSGMVHVSFYRSVSTAWSNTCFPMPGNKPFLQENVVDYFFFLSLRARNAICCGYWCSSRCLNC